MVVEQRSFWPPDDDWQELAKAWDDAVKSRFPFRGIVPVRPYAPTGLTTKRWRIEVPPSIIGFKRLYLTQERIDIMSLFGIPDDHTADDPIPHVVYYNDQYYLEDGHSRVIRLALGFATWTIARVWCRPNTTMLNETTIMPRLEAP